MRSGNCSTTEARSTLFKNKDDRNRNLRVLERPAARQAAFGIGKFKFAVADSHNVLQPREMSHRKSALEVAGEPTNRVRLVPCDLGHAVSFRLFAPVSP